MLFLVRSIERSEFYYWYYGSKIFFRNSFFKKLRGTLSENIWKYWIAKKISVKLIYVLLPVLGADKYH